MDSSDMANGAGQFRKGVNFGRELCDEDLRHRPHLAFSSHPSSDPS